MAKKKKKKRSTEADVPVRKLPRFNYRRTLLIAALLIPTLGFYIFAIQELRFFGITFLYQGIAAALLIWYAIVNRGLGKLTLPPDADEEARKDYERRKALGKKILMAFFPFLFTLILDLFDLYVLGPLMDAAKNL